MTQKEFNDLVKRYLEGDCSDEEATKMEEWYLSQKFEPANIDLEERQIIEKRVWNNIEEKTSINRRFIISKKVWITAVAACLAVVAGIIFYKPSESSLISPESVLTEKNTLLLPDGSEVTLAENSHVYYDKNFNKKNRNVTLVGSAFFNVKPDRTKPFVISSGDLITEVVGTSFEIAQDPDRDMIEVRVVTGEVTVYNPSMKKQTKVVLTPNQKAVYNKLFKNLNRTLVETPEPLPDKVSLESKFIFENASLKKVAETFKEVYGIDFQIEDKEIETCIVNADLENLPMFTKLDLICKSVDASYIINGTTVFLSGEGCN